MLSFISFWRAAAIVLADLASSAYYVGGIAETAIGKSAPWFILGIMLFSYAVRAVYVEGCSMFVRGGVYRVVREAMGPTMAKVAVSALMFDYVLTGPISGVSAGLYLSGLLNELAEHFHQPMLHVNDAAFAVVFAIAATIYFWRKNVVGMHESSEKALRIMQVTTVMVVMLIAWSLYTILARGYTPVPFPSKETLRFGEGALGWLEGTWWASFTWAAVMVGFGHSLLAMSGEESLAQVNREIAHPKLKNLERAGMVIFIYSLVFTSLVSFFAVMLIPDAERGKHLDNLIGGLAMHLAGPEPIRLLFHGFVVVVGTLILSGAVNTSIIGSNGVLNRVAEDGVLPDWFRQPHKKFGTTSRIVTMIAGLQVVTILLSRGNVILLGEAYAFGVIWSFTLKAVSVLMLRFKMPEEREFRVPGNFRIGSREYPVGLALVALTLFTLAVVNLVTKKTATTWGTAFTIAFFVVFVTSERMSRKGRQADSSHEKFALEEASDLDSQALSARKGNVLVAVRNPNQLGHLHKVLEKTDTKKIDIVVVSVSKATAADAGEHELSAQEIFTSREQELFTHVVAMAEKQGKHVELLAVPGADPYSTLVQTATRLESARIVMGGSPKVPPEEQGRLTGRAWERLPQPRPSLSLQVIDAEGKSQFFNMGPHPPRLWPEDVERLHQMWLALTERKFGAALHHRDVVGVALQRMEADLRGGRGAEVMEQLAEEIAHRPAAIESAQ
jgi:amino acid transporter